MKVRTENLVGIALDWAVAKCEGVNEGAFLLYYTPTEPTDYDKHGYPEFHYSTVWSQGGPIVERERLRLRTDHRFPTDLSPWIAGTPWGRGEWVGVGPTLLVAAMRCYVASKLGEEVDVPEEVK